MLAGALIGIEGAASLTSALGGIKVAGTAELGWIGPLLVAGYTRMAPDSKPHASTGLQLLRKVRQLQESRCGDSERFCNEC